MRNLKYGEGSIRQCCKKTKNGTTRRYYQGRFYCNGKQKSVYGRTKEECIKKLRAMRREVFGSGTVERKPPRATEKGFVYYGDWLDEWMKQFKSGKLRGDYYDELIHRIDKIKQALGKKRLSRMQPLELLHYFNSLPRTNSTVKIYDVINGSLQKAEDFGIIKRNPCRAIERPTYEKQKRRAFELDEQTAVLDALAPRYSALFFFLCCTGLRIGEFLSLTKDDVNFVRHCITVDSSLNARTGTEGKTKTAAGVRKVYFADELFEVFDINNLGTYTYNGIKKAFDKVYAKLGIHGISATHSCRHTFASMLYAVGIPDKIIQSQLGHAAVSTTLDIYTDLLLYGSSPVYNYISNLKKVLQGVFSFG